ncbi:pancreatic triacylglycerol lipase-like [Belonocnema kinseyi]|uniref:pancreatic triacylglycerol lipase-like n=1 Tax=Belonocnema kinseyi TaxID=2817044 RepID=UPI00143D42F2|nr:pancreatic triacylglycerol lipase-like [Belonocnema kinseyi]
MLPHCKTTIYSVVNVTFFFLFISNTFAKSDHSSEEENSQVGSEKETATLSLKNFTYALHNSSSNDMRGKSKEVDCFGLGPAFAKALEWLFLKEDLKKHPLLAHFYMVTRKQPKRVHVLVGDQFGLEWTDFDIRRQTVVIVHGFLASGNEEWIHDMEKGVLSWSDVNIIIVDWSEGSNTWNYYRAAVNTKVVGSLIAQLFEQIENATIHSNGPAAPEWGKLYFIGHSLGAHIVSYAANSVTKLPNNWKVERITGLDPAQPCFRNVDKDLLLDKSDAPFVDVIHTNGKLLTSIGLGLPEAIGHVDYYPNGGKTQPGCSRVKLGRFPIPIPSNVITQAICSHGRSYIYFTESIVTSIQQNCTFWAHNWDLTYRRAVAAVNETCTHDKCSEMGINSINHPQRGTFFTLTSGIIPYCSVSESDKEDVLRKLREELHNEVDD